MKKNVGLKRLQSIANAHLCTEIMSNRDNSGLYMCRNMQVLLYINTLLWVFFPQGTIKENILILCTYLYVFIANISIKITDNLLENTQMLSHLHMAGL